MPTFRGKRVTRYNSPYIDGLIGPPPADRNVVPDTRAARKVDSNRRRKSALKNVNKDPLTVHTNEYSSKYSSDHGFVESPQATTYNLALESEDRLKNWAPTMPAYSDGTKTIPNGKKIRSMQDRDTDRVGAYVNTGEDPRQGAGKDWVRDNGVEARKAKAKKGLE